MQDASSCHDDSLIVIQGRSKYTPYVCVCVYIHIYVYKYMYIARTQNVRLVLYLEGPSYRACVRSLCSSRLTHVKLNLLVGFVTTWLVFGAGTGGGNSDVQWCFSQVKGAIDDDVAEGKSTCSSDQ